MKHLLSIFFLFIFLLFQYGKLIAYMECRIVSVIQSTSDCGCETKLQPSAGNEQTNLPFHQHHIKNYTEELFEDLSLFTLTPSSSTTLTSNLQATQLLTGYTNKLLQPPRC
jgi:hypothetical protein